MLFPDLVTVIAFSLNQHFQSHIEEIKNTGESGKKLDLESNGTMGENNSNSTPQMYNFNHSILI